MAHKFHPACELFPEMQPEEYASFKANISETGTSATIWRWGGKILDGRHTLRACDELGLPPTFQEWHPPKGAKTADDQEAAAFKFALSRNLYRRHLNASQVGMIMARIVTTKQGRPEKGQIYPFSVEDAAKQGNISEKTVKNSVAVVREGDPELQAAVSDGTLSVSDAAKVAKLPKDKQRAAVKKVRKKKAKTVAAAAGVNGKAREPGEDETEPQHETATDKAGNPVTVPKLIPIFKLRELFHYADKSRLAMYEHCLKISNNLPGAENLRREIERPMKEVFTALQKHEPAFVCACKGGGCRSCRGKGYKTVS